MLFGHKSISGWTEACSPWAQGPGLSSWCFQGVLESFLGTAVAGAAFCLLAGQPLTILSSTGPVLVFERLLFSFSR